MRGATPKHESPNHEAAAPDLFDFLDLLGRLVGRTLPAESDKIGKGRSLAVAGPLRAILERRQARRIVGCELVFHRRARGKRGEPIRQYRKAWASACRAAGFVAGSRVEGGLIPYDLRRSGLRNLIRAGVSETVAMGISGHRTRDTFDRYNITSVEDTRAALEAVSAWTQRNIRTTVGQTTEKGA